MPAPRGKTVRIRGLKPDRTPPTLKRVIVHRHLNPRALVIAGSGAVSGAITGTSLGGPVGGALGIVFGLGAAALANKGDWFEATPNGD